MTNAKIKCCFLLLDEFPQFLAEGDAIQDCLFVPDLSIFTYWNIDPHHRKIKSSVTKILEKTMPEKDQISSVKTSMDELVRLVVHNDPTLADHVQAGIDHSNEEFLRTWAEQSQKIDQWTAA